MQTGGDDRYGIYHQTAGKSIKESICYHLRYYDEIDFIKTKSVLEKTDIVYMETEQIDTLEQILCYRSLGVSLEEISRLLSATNTEKEQVLQRHFNCIVRKKITNRTFH